MPGIILIVDRDKANSVRNKEVMKKMTTLILHEPFYKYVAADVESMGLLATNVYMDHDDPREKAYTSDDGTLICMLNGEIFGKQEMYSKVNNTEHKLCDTSNVSQCIIALYKQYGVDFLKYVNGLYSLLLVDKVHKTVIFANDISNFHRSFIWRGHNGLVVVAPEVKCCSVYPDAKLTVNNNTVAEYFKYEAVLDRNTFYNEISRLPNASALVMSDDTDTFYEYWNPSAVIGMGKLNEKGYLENSINTFEGIVGEYVTEGKTGLSLTGGWNTRSILSVLSKKKISIPCYTFGETAKDSYDVRAAKKLAAMTGNEFHKIVIGDEFIKKIDHWANKGIFVADGLSRISTSYEYFVNLKARQFAPIRLSGKYGSQIVRHVMLLRDRSPDMRIFSDSFRDFVAKYSKVNKYDPINQIIREEIPYFFGSRQGQELAAITSRTPYLDKRFIEIMLRAPDVDNRTGLQKAIISRNEPAFRTIPTNGGEFIDKTFLNDCFKTWRKWMILMDEAYNWERLPHTAFLISKVGDVCGISNMFNGRAEYRHFRTWFMNGMKQYIKDILLDTSTLNRPWYDAEFIRQMAKYHYAGTKNYTCEIDKIVSLELWLKQNNL